MDLTKITPETIEALLRAAHNGRTASTGLDWLSWVDPSTGETSKLSFEDLLYKLAWQAYADLRQAEGLNGDRPTNRPKALQHITEDASSRNRALAAWSALYYRYFSGISLSVGEMAKAASVVPQHFRKRVIHGLGLLAKDAQRAVLEAEEVGVGNNAVQIETEAERSRIPLPLQEYVSLIGVQPYFELLSQLFGGAEGPGLVSLEGMGGIGKSALARAFISRPETTERWSRIAWVSARQAILVEDGKLSPVADSATTLEDITARLCDQLGHPGLTAQPLEKRLEGLKSALAQEPHLIVVDNLETVNEYRQLVPALGKMAGLSRFLITTRQTLREFPFVHIIPVMELDRDSAYALIEAEIARRGRSRRITPERFDELYQVVGGLPLALKLVAAQLYLRPLSEILAGFREARVGMDTLYHYLFWQTWQSLHEPAKKFLLSFLPSDPEGEDIEFLRFMSDQSEEDFYAALKELDQFSLLEVNGDTERSLYRLHRLTTTFLQTDILHLWEDKTGND